MSAWILVPCLVALRSEFNAVSPNRDRGADGSIGDSAHTSSSDHTPDEDSDILRGHDADSKNEVHALDIDSSGPWPGGAAWFDRTIKAIVERERQEYQSPTAVGRLKYVIWNRRIASRSEGWAWRAYTLADPHTNHAHFSARYESGPEADTRPWGVDEEDDVTADEIRNAARQGLVDVLSSANRASVGQTTKKDATGKTVPLTDQERAYDRQVLAMLRSAVGGPTEPAALSAQVVAQLKDLGQIPAGISADAVAELLAQKLAARLAA